MRSTSVSLAALICCVSIATSFKLKTSQREHTERFISYISYKEVISDQRVVITDIEAEFQMINGMHAVFDYKQKLMTLRRSPKESTCLVAPFEQFKTLEEIRYMIRHDSKFPMPQKQWILHLKKAENLNPITLSPLSAVVCEGANVIRMQHKPVLKSTALLPVRVPLRPKREVVWGEIVVIVTAIVVLL